MPTLTKVTSETRFVLKWGGILISALIIIFLAAKIGTAIKEKFYPSPGPLPTVSFGKLDPIKFPKTPTNKSLNFTIDTIPGTLPVFPDRTKVYKTSANRVDFLSLEKAQKKVSLLGFPNQKTLVSENTYQWVSNEPLLRKISFNISTSNFVYSSSFITDPNVNSGANLPAESEAINTGKKFLENLSSFPSDIDLTKTKTSLHTIKNYTLIKAEKLSKAQIIRVDFFQKDIDKMPIYYSNPSTSNINLLIAGGENSPQVVEALYLHENISQEFATYPIKSASQAFSELKQGKAYILHTLSTTNVAIKNVFLGYYLAEQNQKYLMPIVIFEGDNGFFAYVSAVRDEWVGN